MYKISSEKNKRLCSVDWLGLTGSSGELRNNDGMNKRRKKRRTNLTCGTLRHTADCTWFLNADGVCVWRSTGLFIVCCQKPSAWRWRAIEKTRKSKRAGSGQLALYTRRFRRPSPRPLAVSSVLDARCCRRSPFSPTQDARRALLLASTPRGRGQPPDSPPLPPSHHLKKPARRSTPPATGFFSVFPCTRRQLRHLAGALSHLAPFFRFFAFGVLLWLAEVVR